LDGTNGKSIKKMVSTFMNLFNQGNSTAYPSQPFLIVGLGNPGREYRYSRHNTGFMAMDRFAKGLGVELNRVQSNALVSTTTFSEKRLILAKPQTFMNLSGKAVSSLLRFYKVPLENLLVIHDDLDLPVGTLRLRPEGGSAGQKGLGSVIELLGTENFPRLRIGIGRPPGRMETMDYVLEAFSEGDFVLLEEILNRGEQAIKVFIVDGIVTAMNQFNGAISKE
jgi:peptidyl-tRNA hydrolase, PTH1 family